MATNILLLPVFTEMTFAVKNTADWRDALAFRTQAEESLDITGITFRAQLRTAVDSPVLAGGDFELSTENGLLVNGGTTGLLSWRVPRSMMIGLEAGTYLMDIEARDETYWLNLFPDAPATVKVTQGVTR
jgi:hypothetical protein